jgi:hypothetical protein
MFYSLRKLYHPEFYQGPRRTARYFEGWYYKAVVDGKAFAVIPGVSRAADDPHAFIQRIDGEKGESWYHRYPLDSFAYRKDEFEITIGPNRFALDGYNVELPDFTCSFATDGFHGWPTSLFSPGTMGWYSFVPFMECKHGVIVRSFPNAWIWLQSNHFQDDADSAQSRPATSVTCSIGNVPFVGGAFTGFLAAFLLDGRLHRFTTYTGSKLTHMQVDDDAVFLRISDPVKSLEIEARREAGATLAAPAQGVMSGRITETIRSSVIVTLEMDGRQVFNGTGIHAGLEVVAHERLETA